MPSKNTVKEFAPNSFYHVYNRGVERRVIFMDDQDYTVFIGLLKKYITGENHNKNNRHMFTPLSHAVSVIAYCLMPNHFHLLLYQYDITGITQLMRRINTGYAMYFNNKYGREGRLFQGTYKASYINSDAYLHHISRYIHLNPTAYDTWPYSSLEYYKGEKTSDWLKTGPILELFNDDRAEYLRFVADYVEARDELAILKHQLANNDV